MKEFYEPMLFMSTPEHPNTMGVLAVLKEAVDGEILREAVEVMRERFPYFYVRVAARGGDLVTVDNPLPMIVRGTWAPVCFLSEETNFHLAAWKYEGKRLCLEISHSLTDGAGVLPYVKSVLYFYLSKKSGVSLDPAGFHLPGEEIPESETGNPFQGMDVDGAAEPMYRKKPTPDFFRLKEAEERNQTAFFLRLSEEQLMQYCRDYDGSPNAFLSVLLARAARRCDPDSEKTVTVSVAIDYKAMLGVRENYRMFANVVELDFPKSRSLEDTLKSCTVARGQIMLQAQPENVLWALKQRKGLYARLDAVPLEGKLGIAKKSAGTPRWSLSVSYVNSRSFGPLDPFIEAVYLIAEPGVIDVSVEISCFAHSFFLTIAQGFSSERFIDAFLRELSEVGIDFEVKEKEPLRLCGIASYEGI